MATWCCEFICLLWVLTFVEERRYDSCDQDEREVLGLFEEYIGTHVYYYALLLSFSSWPCVVRYQIVC